MGRGITVAMVDPTTAPASITAGTTEVYIFAEPVYRAVIDIDPDYAGKLKIRWNDTDASATVWDHSKSAESVVFSPDDLRVTKVSIYAESANAVLGTDFSVKGLHE